MTFSSSRCPKADGPNQENWGNEIAEHLTCSDISEMEDEDKDVGETKENERSAMKTDQVPQTLFGRWAVFACAIANYGLGLALPLAMSTMFIEWQHTFKINRAHTVVVHSSAIGLLFGAAIVPGYLMERYGARFTVLLGCCLSSVGCFISIFATSINYLIFSVGILGGLGFCFIQLPTIPCACQDFPKHGNLVTSACTSSSAILNMSLPFVYRHLINTFSWRGTFAFIAAFSMQTAVLGLIMTSYLRNPRRRNSSLKEEGKGLELDILLKESGSELRNINQEVFTQKEFISGEETKCFGEVVDTTSCTGDKTRDKKYNLDRISVLGKPNSPVSRIINSKWKFLFDGMYLLIMFHIATCLAVQFCFPIVIMDFARTKGFPEDFTGTFFLLVIFLSSLIGRLIVGALNFLPFIHSITLLGVFGVISSFGMIMLGSHTDYTTIVVFLAFQGFGVGGVVSIYPKCVLDADRVNLKNYPLALGLSCTWEGIFDFLIPILIGHAVDTQGSYTMIFHLLGSISLASSFTVIAIKFYMDFKTCRLSPSDIKTSS